MKKKEAARITRHKRLRKKLYGTADCPRLCVHRGLKTLDAQIVDDISAKTLLSISTQSKDVKGKAAYGGNVKASAALGELLAEKAKEKGISKLVFDRGGYQYHGRVKALAEAVRKGGIKF